MIFIYIHKNYLSVSAAFANLELLSLKLNSAPLGLTPLVNSVFLTTMIFFFKGLHLKSQKLLSGPKLIKSKANKTMATTSCIMLITINKKPMSSNPDVFAKFIKMQHKKEVSDDLTTLIPVCP